jgi:hypothetical protein
MPTRSRCLTSLVDLHIFYFLLNFLQPMLKIVNKIKTTLSRFSQSSLNLLHQWITTFLHCVKSISTTTWTYCSFWICCVPQSKVVKTLWLKEYLQRYFYIYLPPNALVGLKPGTKEVKTGSDGQTRNQIWIWFG